MKVKCPGCGQPARYATDNPWRPFCSERCKRIDLGAWASEQYRIPGNPLEPEIGADPNGTEPQTH